ncbi:MAG: hypothetical protein O2955_05760 [Planctomycetota bacterium]|nr:hypothetical protein [Planctomycetota bacterium]MDA1211999.1 hypothetical protein [Planctomycetota bacterium]
MKLSADCQPFLSGRRFSSHLEVKFDFDGDDHRYRSRVDWLLDICRGKQILHVGCVDHDIGSIRSKMLKRKWLHQLLVEVSACCHGIDLNAEGIEFMRTELGFDELTVANAVGDIPGEILNRNWDVLLLAEVLEHIGNPVDFLTRMYEKYRHCARELIITVPNAFAYENLRFIRRRKENINSDHFFWFTPYTLAHVVTEAGMSPGEIIMCRGGVVKPWQLYRNSRLSKNPLLRNNILMRIPLNQSNDQQSITFETEHDELRHAA